MNSNFENIDETFSANDLIYLFLDGQASDIEKTTLFAALASDSNLQLEFQEAIQCKNAINEETQEMAPSVMLTNSIFETIGIASSAGIAAASPTISNSISSIVSSNASQSLSMQFMTLMKSPIALISLSFLLGSLSTYFLSNNQNNPDNKKQIIANASNTDANASSNNVSTNSNLENHSIERNSSNQRRLGKQITSASKLETKLQANANSNSNSEINPNKNSSNLFNKKQEDSNTEDLPNLTLSETKSNRNLSDNLSDIIPNNFSESKLIVEELKSKQTTAPVLIDSPEFEQDQNNDAKQKIENKGSSTYFFSIKSINSISYFDQRNQIDKQTDQIDNLQLSILYNLSENHSLGLSIGKENFPIYVKGSDDKFTLHSSLIYLGAMYKWNFYELDFAGKIKTNLNTLLAASNSSAINKSGLELVWMPDSKLAINFGIEAMLNASKYNSKYEITGKSSFYYGLTYNF